jgi:hypothetical protein
MVLRVAMSGRWSYAALKPDPGKQRGRGQEMPVIVLWRRATTVIGLVRPPPAFVSSTCVPLWDHE